MQFDIVILAGGRGSRMGFKDKGLLKFKGQTLISILATLAHNNSENVYISCNDNLEKYGEYGIAIVDEVQNFAGPLAGISSALSHATNKYLLVLAVDTPNITQYIINDLLKNMDKHTDICVAFDGEHIHPTIMLLKTHLKENIDDFLQSGERKLGFFIRQQRYKKILVQDKIELLNINYQHQLQS